MGAGTGIPLCQAKTAYVSDMLILTFREGPGTQHAVMKTLKSNTPLTILEEENGFYKAQLETGEQGWVDKNFIMFDPPKSIIIEKLNREKEKLESQIATLKESAGRSKEEAAAKEAGALDKADSLAAELTRLKQENKTLSQSLAREKSEFTALKNATQNIAETLEDNTRLKAENKTLSSTISRLENQTSNVFRSAMIKWFLAGFGVLLFGWVIGRSVSSKKRGGGSLLD
ncbi:MAG: TIGR04211 family SH3 domain-containing protein [Desulfobacter sp.]|nr:MAG: TIGR04211 family SH3 domain-containing protein [Desulfobacter sp.]